MKILNLFLVFAISLCLASCGTQTKKEADNTQNKEEVSAQPEKPSDADLMAFKVYHHMVYMVTTAKQAGGTNNDYGNGITIDGVGKIYITGSFRNIFHSCTFSRNQSLRMFINEIRFF